MQRSLQIQIRSFLRTQFLDLFSIFGMLRFPHANGISKYEIQMRRKTLKYPCVRINEILLQFVQIKYSGLRGTLGPGYFDPINGRKFSKQIVILSCKSYEIL